MVRVDADRCAWRQVSDRVVVLDLTGSVYFELNPAGAALWPQLVRGAEPAELVDALCRPSAGPDARTRVRSRIDDFLGQLDDAGLLVTGGTAETGR